jgi:hypothetical protein
MSWKIQSFLIAAITQIPDALRAAATRVRIQAQKRHLRKVGWSWYEVDCRDRPPPYTRPRAGQKRA